jgi:hypothetical protein
MAEALARNYLVDERFVASHLGSDEVEALASYLSFAR